MASASPRLSPRPPAPSTLSVSITFLFDCAKISLLFAAVAVALKPVYDAARGYVGITDRLWFVVSTVLVHETLYYGGYAMFATFDHFQLLQQFKLARKPSQIPSPSLIQKTLRESAISHWVIQPISVYLLYPLFAAQGTVTTGPLPPFGTLVWQIAVAVLLNDTMFYWTHRYVRPTDTSDCVRRCICGLCTFILVCVSLRVRV